ncbi:RNA-binding protein 7 [Selaginella moellendorffii]|uniref:RNA-binding protein 7 n=1 Tax=Selaginella moellendorffii TaxID=88036 RepID=UPI000D1C973D|nr:RNA-binding protein 7 [Selaginella moellendorffii]|eukprot:XP_024542793.1 RNA-binding protein 7 [Selaginella moellendorffii]
MPGGNVDATLYVSNLDDRVDERVLYDIMVQAGPLVEVYIPRDKETKRHRGYGFAEYESEESASYALRLFSGLVTLHNRPVNFAFSGGAKKVPQQQQQQQQSSLFDPTLDQTPPSSKFERFLSASSSSDRESYYSGQHRSSRYSSRVAMLVQRTNHGR